MERSTTRRSAETGVRGEREVEHAHRAGLKEGAGRSIAQSFSLIVGLALIAGGILGFFFGGEDFNTGTNVQGEQFLGFEVNGWHNVVHIATGAFLVLMAATARSAITGLLVFGIAYVGVTVWGFVDGNDVVNVIPVNTADNILHAVLAGASMLVALVAGGFLKAARKDEHAVSRGR